MRVLVTGSSGFIGTHLTDALLARGDDVIGYDVVPSPRRCQERFCSYVADVCDRDTVAGVFGAHYPDAVMHLASKVGVKHYHDDPLGVMRTTINGTSIVAQPCLEGGVPMLFTSTSEVYGTGARIPMREADDLVFGATTSPRWSYGLSKAIAEHTLLAMRREHSLDARIVRPFNVVGPGQSVEGGHIFPAFANAVATQSPIVVYGQGAETRTYCAVERFVAGLLRVIDAPRWPHSTAPIVNLGDDREYSVYDVAKQFSAAGMREHGVATPIVFRPHRDVYGASFQETPRRVPDLALAREILSWDDLPREPIADTIARTIDAQRGAIASTDASENATA